MTSAREAALLALHQRLQAVPDTTVLRNEVLPSKIPAGGLVILRDGDPGEPEVTLNPVSYLWQHRAEIEVVVEAATPVASPPPPWAGRRPRCRGTLIGRRADVIHTAALP